MKDLHDVDASKPYLSIFVHFRGRHVLQSAGRRLKFFVFLFCEDLFHILSSPLNSFNL